MCHNSCPNLLEFLEFVSKDMDKGVPFDVVYLNLFLIKQVRHWWRLHGNGLAIEHQANKLPHDC